MGDGTPPAVQCCTLTQKSVRGLGDPSPGHGSSSLAAQTGTQPTTDGRPFNRPTPGYGISFLRGRGGGWQPCRSAVFVSLLCGRVSSTWQLERAGWRKSDPGSVCVDGRLSKKGVGCPGDSAPHLAPQSRLRSLFRDFSGGKFMIHPVPRPHLQVGPRLPGSGPGADPPSKLCCGSPQPRQAWAWGQG